MMRSCVAAPASKDLLRNRTVTTFSDGKSVYLHYSSHLKMGPCDRFQGFLYDAFTNALKIEINGNPRFVMCSSNELVNRAASPLGAPTLTPINQAPSGSPEQSL